MFPEVGHVYVVILLATLSLANALAMLVAPEFWYHAVPGVVESGAFNAHFIRDIGVVYALCGLSLVWRLLDPLRAWPFVLFGALFLSCHAIVHLGELLFAAHHAEFYASDVFGIYLPAVLMCWLARPGFLPLPRLVARFASALIRKQIASFEQRYGYDAGYLHEMAEADLEAVTRFSAQQSFAAYRGTVPMRAWYAAHLLGCLHEDCGPCAQLVVRMAEEEGVPAVTIEGVVRRRFDELDDETALAARFAEAVLARQPEAYEYQQQIEARWGKRGLFGLGFALTSGRVFPQVKYALGHGRACSEVRIGERTTRVTPTRATAPA